MNWSLWAFQSGNPTGGIFPVQANCLFFEIRPHVLVGNARIEFSSVRQLLSGKHVGLRSVLPTDHLADYHLVGL